MALGKGCSFAGKVSGTNEDHVVNVATSNFTGEFLQIEIYDFIT